MQSHRRELLLFVVLTLAGTAKTFASAITFFNTGVGANGSALAAGATDSHYNLIYDPDGVVETSTATAANANWVQSARTAGWISPGASGNTSWSAGYYVYETTLNLTGYDPTTAVLSGLLAADDVVSIYLNHVNSAVFTASGYSSVTAFSLSSGFVSGLNTVDFVVQNGSGPTGLLVEGTAASASALAPEPAALLLVTTGVLLAAGVIRLKGERTSLYD